MRLERSLLAAAFILSVLACNMAAVAENRPAPDQAQPIPAPYTLAAGDRVMVTVLGQSDLTGDLPVDGEGNLTFPLIGAVHVEGLTTQQTQELIRTRLADGYLVNPNVSVRMGEPRPLYILGSVRSSGAYPFRFGTVVRAAIAAAGGYAFSDPQRNQVVAEAMAANERLQQLVLEQSTFLVRRARLQAEVRGDTSFTVPDLSERPPQDKLAQIVAAETDALRSQLSIVKAKVDLLEAQKPRVRSQIEAKKSEVASMTRRLELVRNETQWSEALMRRGIGTRTATLQNKRDEATEEVDLWRLNSETSSLERELGDLDLRIQNEELALRNQAAAELQTANNRIAELEVQVPAARVQRDWKMRQAGGSIDPAGSYRITITRVQGGAAKVTAASETTQVEPGDVIEVAPANSGSGEALYSLASVQCPNQEQRAATARPDPLLLPVSAGSLSREMATTVESATTLRDRTVTHHVEPAAKAAHVEPTLSQAGAEVLISRGDALLGTGDIASARLFYQRAANGGNDTAALRLGETFDPAFLAEARLGRVADYDGLRQARFWYARARDLGNHNANLLLDNLKPVQSH